MNREQVVFKTIRKIARDEQRDEVAQGTVVSASYSAVRVRLAGKAQTVSANLNTSLKLSAGDKVTLLRPPGSDRWIVASAFATLRSGSSSGGGNPIPHPLEIAPPGNFRTFSGLAGNIIVGWDVPPQFPGAFELQYNASGASGTPGDEVSGVMTRGAYGIIAQTVPRWLRVRSVSPDFRYSGWSPWLLGTPYVDSTGGGGVTTLDGLTDVDLTVPPTNGQVLTYESASSLWKAATIAGGSGGASGIDVQVFTPGTSTWTRPTGAQWVEVHVYGSGGGGGSGRKGAAGSARGGGGGGGNGGYSYLFLPASDLGATESVFVSAGGGGGPAQATNSNNGTIGSAGADSYVGPNVAGAYIRALGGGGGAAGNTTTASGGSTGDGIEPGRAGGAGSPGTSAAPAAGNNAYNGSAGGGGGISAANALLAAANSGVPGAQVGRTGAVAGLPGGNGFNGPAGSHGTPIRVGGAGGSASLGGTGGSGGSGGFGSGGGGGGASVDSVGNSGAGGAGGDGIVVIVTYLTGGSGGSGSGNTITLQAFADSRPVAPVSGDLVMLSDGLFNLIYDGAAWLPILNGKTLVDPALETWAWHHQDTAVLDNSHGGEHIHAELQGSGDNLMMREMDISALVAPWQITACVLIDLPHLNYAEAGIQLWDTANDVGISIGHLSDGGLPYQWCRHWASYNTNPFSFSAIYANVAMNTPTWFRVINDATDLHFLYSIDGIKYVEVGVEGVTNYLTTIDRAGIHLNNNAGSHPDWNMGITLLSWAIE